MSTFYRENTTSFLDYVTATLRTLYSWRGSFKKVISYIFTKNHVTETKTSIQRRLCMLSEHDSFKISNIRLRSKGYNIQLPVYELRHSYVSITFLRHEKWQGLILNEIVKYTVVIKYCNPKPNPAESFQHEYPMSVMVLLENIVSVFPVQWHNINIYLIRKARNDYSLNSWFHSNFIYIQWNNGASSSIFASLLSLYQLSCLENMFWWRVAIFLCTYLPQYNIVVLIGFLKEILTVIALKYLVGSIMILYD